jgi:hypothetical protein
MNTTRFKGIVVDTNQSGASSVFSPDNKAVSVLFSDLRLETAGGGGDFLIKTHSVSLQIPIESSSESTLLTQYIRGYVYVEDSAQAVLIVHSSGKTTIVDLHDMKDENFTKSVVAQLDAGNCYQICLILLVECKTDHVRANALLSIDSLDITIGTIEQTKQAC